MAAVLRDDEGRYPGRRGFATAGGRCATERTRSLDRPTSPEGGEAERERDGNGNGNGRRERDGNGIGNGNGNGNRNGNGNPRPRP
jgi:hypothetical protein